MLFQVIKLMHVYDILLTKFSARSLNGVLVTLTKSKNIIQTNREIFSIRSFSLHFVPFVSTPPILNIHLFLFHYAKSMYDGVSCKYDGEQLKRMELDY